MLERCISTPVLAGLALFQGLSGQAAVVQLRPVADTTLIEAVPDNNLGGMEFFNSGTTQNGTRNRGLLQFDFGGVIPSGSVIQEAYLELTVVQTPPPGGAQGSLFGIYRMLQPWGEGVQVSEPGSPGLGALAAAGEATWNHRFFGGPETWSTPGGADGLDYFSTPSSVEFIEDEDIYLFGVTPRLISDVQSWVSDPSSNYGWMLLSFSEDLRYTARRFASREDVFSGPLLTVTYEPIPEPSIWILGLLGLFGMRRLRGGRFSEHGWLPSNRIDRSQESRPECSPPTRFHSPVNLLWLL